MESNIIIIHYTYQNLIHPVHRSKVTAVSLRFGIFGHFLGTKNCTKMANFCAGTKLLVEVVEHTLSNKPARFQRIWTIICCFIIRARSKKAKLRKLRLRWLPSDKWPENRIFDFLVVFFWSKIWWRIRIYHLKRQINLIWPVFWNIPPTYTHTYTHIPIFAKFNLKYLENG